MTEIIYISGQISGLKKAEYIAKFLEAERRCSGRNIQIINPIKFNPFLGIPCWICYMITSIWKLRKATRIALIKNWENSRGAFIEHFFAKFIFRINITKL